MVTSILRALIFLGILLGLFQTDQVIAKSSYLSKLWNRILPDEVNTLAKVAMFASGGVMAYKLSNNFDILPSQLNLGNISSRDGWISFAVFIASSAVWLKARNNTPSTIRKQIDKVLAKSHSKKLLNKNLNEQNINELLSKFAKEQFSYCAAHTYLTDQGNKISLAQQKAQQLIRYSPTSRHQTSLYSDTKKLNDILEQIGRNKTYLENTAVYCNQFANRKEMRSLVVAESNSDATTSYTRLEWVRTAGNCLWWFGKFFQDINDRKK